MENRVRIECSENIVRNAAVFLRGPDGEWVDVRHAVQKTTVMLEVGAVSRAHLDLMLVDSEVEAFRLDDETQEAFAEALRQHGWKVEGSPEPPTRDT